MHLIADLIGYATIFTMSAHPGDFQDLSRRSKEIKPNNVITGLIKKAY